MKRCTECNNIQAEGNFCGKCGGPLEVEAAQTIDTELPDSPVEPAQTTHQQHTHTEGKAAQNSEQLDQIKQHSKAYFAYFMQQLQSPSNQVHEAANQKNHLISVIVYIVLTAISIYTLLNSAIGMSVFNSYGPSFIQILLSTLVFLAIGILMSVVAIYITSKLFSDPLNFKTVLAKIGSYFALPILLSTAGIVLSIIGSNFIASFSVYIGVSLAIGLIPLYIMIKQLTLKSKGIDGFYAFLFYLVVTAVIGTIIGLFIMDSAFGDMMNYML